MTALDSKKLMKMDRLQLMELLQKISQENEALTLRAAQLEVANAKLTLSTREAEHAQAEAQRALESLRTAAPDLSALPTGSFAEAMVQTAAIVEKTQQAADAYLARAKSVLEEAKQEADELLSAARQQADTLTADAQAKADALTTEAAANKARMEEEFAGMSARLHAEMQHITSLMQGMKAPEAEA